MSDLFGLNIKPGKAEEILAKKNRFSLAAYSEQLLSQQIEAIDIFSPDYPAILKEIYDPPLVLYKKGPLKFDQLQGLAVVGTRRPSAYGLKATENLVSEFKGSGCTIVSGLALGIDTAAHTAALKNELPTIAVLGTGLDVIYPRENKKLCEQIFACGAVISENPLAAKAQPWHFPRRNRIITGLSRAVLVMEGDLKSGAMISGKIALAQDREVYALPGSIFASTSIGPNWLIGEGARPLLSANQVLSEVFSAEQLHFKNLEVKKVFLSAEEEKIYECLANEEGYLLDDLLDKTGLSIPRLMQIVLSLELKGLITQLPGKRIIRS